MSDADRVTINKIESFKKINQKELKVLKGSLNEQEKHFNNFLLIIKNRPYTFVPIKSDFLAIFDLAHFRSAIQYFNAKALIAYREKQFERVKEYLQDASYLTKKLEDRKGPLIDQLVVLACKGIVYDRVNWILRHKNYSLKYLVDLENILKNMKAPDNVWSDTVKYEMFFSNGIQEFSQHIYT